MQPLGSGEFFEKNGLLFLPTEEVGKITGQFESAAPLIEIMAGDPSIRGLTGALETGLAGVKRGEVKLDNTARPFNLIAQTVEDVLNKGNANFSWRELSATKPLTDSDKRAFIEFKPVIDYSALEPGKEATDAIRKAAADLDFAGKYQARVRLTGPVPIANEEYATVQDGAIVNGIGTVLVVLVILWLALHSAKIIFAVFVNLFIGLSITTAVGLADGGLAEPAVDRVRGAVRRPRRRLRHPVQRPLPLRAFQERQSGRGAGGGARGASAVPLSLAAMATAAGFLCFLPTDYKGISELGEIAGAGMLIAFFSTHHGAAGDAEADQSARRERAGRLCLPRAGRPLPRKASLRDRRSARWLVAVAGLPLLYFMKFDFNPMNLRNPEGGIDRDLPRPAQGSRTPAPTPST